MRLENGNIINFVIEYELFQHRPSSLFLTVLVSNFLSPHPPTTAHPPSTLPIAHPAGQARWTLSPWPPRGSASRLRQPPQPAVQRTLPAPPALLRLDPLAKSRAWAQTAPAPPSPRTPRARRRARPRSRSSGSWWELPRRILASSVRGVDGRRVLLHACYPADAPHRRQAAQPGGPCSRRAPRRVNARPPDQPCPSRWSRVSRLGW